MSERVGVEFAEETASRRSGALHPGRAGILWNTRRGEPAVSLPKRQQCRGEAYLAFVARVGRQECLPHHASDGAAIMGVGGSRTAPTS
jgi:hypothetical protein